jgi:hypothetical protein
VSGKTNIPGQRKIHRMKRKLTLTLILLSSLGACALLPSWHWEKPGASKEELEFDQNQCKAKVYSGSGGDVTNESVRRMFACMQAKGWRKVDN